MSKPVVLATAPLHPQAQAALAEVATPLIAPDAGAETLRQLARDAEAIIVRNPLPADIVDHAPRLRLIVRHGTGLDFVPVDAATRAGVMVANAPDANVQAVVEYVIGAMLTLARRFHAQDRAVRAGHWTVRNRLGVELAGKTLGIVGLGRIGSRLALAAHSGFGMTIVAHDPSPRHVPNGVEMSALQPLLRRADFVSLHVPLLGSTEGLIGRSELAEMKSSAFLINAARGSVVVEADLISALSSGRIAGGAIDVFETQPLAADHPLCQLENVLLTPHAASLTGEAMLRMGLDSVSEVCRVLAGGIPNHFVNPSCIGRTH